MDSLIFVVQDSSAPQVPEVEEKVKAEALKKLQGKVERR
jgi:hypothetical protein